MTENDKIAALEARIEELERKAKPPEQPNFNTLGPRGPTTSELAMSRMGMSPQAMRAMVDAVPDSAVAGILRDGRAIQNLAPLASDVRPRPAATGWEAPLSPPPGISLIDRQLDVQDAKDRAERIMLHARMKAVEKK
jgi:hypothetical protein